MCVQIKVLVSAVSNILELIINVTSVRFIHLCSLSLSLSLYFPLPMFLAMRVCACAISIWIVETIKRLQGLWKCQCDDVCLVRKTCLQQIDSSRRGAISKFRMECTKYVPLAEKIVLRQCLHVLCVSNEYICVLSLYYDCRFCYFRYTAWYHPVSRISS